MKDGLLAHMKKAKIDYLNVINIHDLTADIVDPLRIGQLAEHDFLVQESAAVKHLEGPNPTLLQRDNKLVYAGNPLSAKTPSS